jgi:hypothetical protein
MKLERVTPLAFLRPTSVGRTSPSILLCELEDKSTVEVVAKFSAGCFNVGGLAMEVISACLAGDLGLPVPQPLLIEVPAQWVETVSDEGRRKIMSDSVPVAFGSKVATPGYRAWHLGAQVSEAMLPIATAIFVFDAIIQNPDRRPANPNCLVRNNDLLIFDHELTFAEGIIGWKAPWVLGGLESVSQPGNHIFRDGLRGGRGDLSSVEAAWKSLSDDHLQSYLAALPSEWSDASRQATKAIELVRDARDNFDGCLKEVARVLQ